MNLFRELVLSHSERHLAKYRTSAREIEEEMHDAYTKYVPMLQNCYARASYWHGTGHYHYAHSNDSRFIGSETGRVIDVFAAILERRALRGHQDLWTAAGTPCKTVSVAPSRMHARLYAHIHLRENVLLPYVFGGTRFWMGFFLFFGLTGIFSHRTPGQRDFIKQIFNKRFFKHGRVWASAVRDLSNFKILPAWRAYDLRSDIEGNYPILFGIANDAVEGDGVVPFLHNVEVRVAGDISLRHITHVEVPLAHTNHTKTTLDRWGVSLPVIPLEFGELFCSQMPVAQLAHV